MNMIIKCQEHYDKVVEYAKSIGDNTLQQCIERLQQWEKNSNGKYEIELYWDFAPHSFGFAERTPDGRTGVVGGVLYHGRPDESYAVMLNPFHGWSSKHSIFRYDNFIGCFSADKIKMSARKYFCFNIPIYKNMAEEPSCRSPYHEEYIQTSVSGNPEDLYRSTYSFLSERR